MTTTLEFTTVCNAPVNAVWHTLWSKELYTKWTTPFQEGCYFIGDFSQGSQVKFMGNEEGKGMLSTVLVNKENEQMSLKHEAFINNFETTALDEEMTTLFADSREEYFLSIEEGNTILKTILTTPTAYADYFQQTFPKALALVKSLAEQIELTVQLTVDAPIQKVWDSFTQPEHITQWYFASPDWHCPKASNDLRVGGTFVTTMAAKDGSMGFDFKGTYSQVQPISGFEYHIEDGRRVVLTFIAEASSTHIIERFKPEAQFSLAMQESGWLSILANFKKYVEGNAD